MTCLSQRQRKETVVVVLKDMTSPRAVPHRAVACKQVEWFSESLIGALSHQPTFAAGAQRLEFGWQSPKISSLSKNI
jgi:hypothetical protein